MATDIDRTSQLQSLADSTGFIIDRTVNPEKVVGLAWLISKGRVLTLASSVSNYAEAPWALLIRFPHPQLNFSVRTVTLHPDFNKREARDYYLAQALGPLGPLMLDNDIATVALDSDLTPPPPEKISELNRALSVPFEISAQDMSGHMRSGDVPAILQSVLSTGRTGLLTMIDTRNIPFARIAVRQTRIVRASFQHLFNEVAMCELIWRQPPGSFAFQPIDYRWPADIPEIVTPTEQILGEAKRRFDELPTLIDNMGGPDVRFIKATPLVDFGSINVGERWLAERLWECIDGYLPLSKMSDRVGSDSYSTVKMLFDLATMGLITIEMNSPFHGSGQLGPLILPAQDLELSTWDQLTAFYIDPASGNPVSVPGNFFGGAHVINNKTLLHTAPVPPSALAAIMLKDGKLVALHSGPTFLRGVVNPPPIALQRMLWIGSLNDLGTKRLRTAEHVAEALAAGEGAAPADSGVSQRVSLRMRSASETTSTDVEPTKERESGPLAKFSKMQIAAAAGVVFALSLIMMLSSMFSSHGQQAPPAATPGKQLADQANAPAADNAAPAADTSTSTTTTTGTAATVPGHPDYGDAAAAKVAYSMLGLTKPPDSFVFSDSSKKTAPKPSFELISESKDLDIVFIEWPNQGPIGNMEFICKHTPVYDLYRCDERTDEFQGTLAHVQWVGGHYKSGDKVITAAVGVWDPGNGKAIVFVAGPLTGTSISDMEYPARLAEGLIADAAKSKLLAQKSAGSTKEKSEANSASSSDDTNLATAEQLSAYRKKLAQLIKSHYKPPHFDLDTDTKVSLKLNIDSQGTITDIELVPNANDDFNQALQRAVDLVKPMPIPPKTRSGKYALQINAHADDINVEEQ